MQRAMPAVFGESFQLKITLQEVRPAVWRGVRVPADLTLSTLHDVLQIAFGWQNSHLHDFCIGEVRFGMADVEDDLFVVDENAAPLGAVARAGSRFVYRYDFGDDWVHEITVEDVTNGGESIECTGGARACPPEDCGGVPGYERLLQILADPADDEHADMKRWIGRKYDPEKFEIAAINKKLAALSKRLGRLSHARSPRRRP